MCLEEFFNIYDQLYTESKTFIKLASKERGVLSYGKDSEFSHIDLDSESQCVIINYIGYDAIDSFCITIPVEILLDSNKVKEYIQTLKKEYDSWVEAQKRRIAKETEERERRQYEELKKKFEK